MGVFALEPQIHRRLVAQRPARECRAYDLALQRPRVARVRDHGGVGMQPVGQRIAPELIETALHRPAARHAVAQIDVRGGIARHAAALATRETVLELAGGKELCQHPVGPVELADLAERSVGDEVHRILAVPHRQIDRESTRRVRGIECDQITAAVGLDRPPGFEAPRVAQRAHQRRTHERRIGQRHAAQAPPARPRGRHVTETQLLEPAMVAPHTRPRGVDVHAAVLGRPDALGKHLQRAPAHVGAEPEGVGRAGKRIFRRREQRVVDHHAVPRWPLQTQRHVGAQRVRTPQIRFARRLAPQAPRNRKLARVHDRRAELGPIDGEQHAQQVAEALAADVQLTAFEPPELRLDVHATVAELHRVAASVDDDALVAGVHRRLQPTLRRHPMADLHKLEELRHRQQHFGSHSVRLYGGPREAADPQLDDDRLGRRIRGDKRQRSKEDRSRRRGLGDSYGLGKWSRKAHHGQQRPHPRAANHRATGT